MSIYFWLQNLLLYSLQVLLVVLAGGVLLLVIRLRSPKLELASLHGFLALCLILPFVQPKQALVYRQASVVASVANGSETPNEERDRIAGFFTSVAIVGWLLVSGAAARLLWLGLGFARLARYRKGSEPLPRLPGSDFHEQFGNRAALRISREIRGPVTFGWLRPVILLPERFLEFEPELQQAILCHELLHVARRDWLVTVIEESIRALLWFHPAIWWLVGRIHLVREQFVDRETIRLTDARDAYLRALLATAGRHLQPDLAPASLFLRRHHLDQRVSAVLRKEIPMSRLHSIASFSTLGAAMMTAVWLASSAFPLQAVPQQGDQVFRPMGSVYVPNKWQGVVEQGGDKLLREPQVTYPMEAIDKKIEGRVVLEVSLDENGRVYDAMVVSGPPELRRDALQSALRWQYSKDLSLPAKRLVTIRFELPKDDGAPPPATATPPTPPQRIRVGSVVQQARLERSIPPQYPALARQARIQGTVDLKVVIGTSGAVALIDVLGGHPLLIPATVDAVRQWEYRPTLLNGVPIEVETTVAVNFSMSNDVTAGANNQNATPVTPVPLP